MITMITLLVFMVLFCMIIGIAVVHQVYMIATGSQTCEFTSTPISIAVDGCSSQKPIHVLLSPEGWRDEWT